MPSFLHSIGLVFLLTCLLGQAQTPTTEGKTAPEVDPVSGMKIDEHWEITRAMCSSCHSPKLFTSYGGTRATWAGLIDWMQKKQGLWELPSPIEEQILTYLTKNYPPGEVSRRRPLPVHLRPPNPYVSDTRAEYEEKLEQGEIKKPNLKAE